MILKITAPHIRDPSEWEAVASKSRGTQKKRNKKKPDTKIGSKVQVKMSDNFKQFYETICPV